MNKAVAKKMHLFIHGIQYSIGYRVTKKGSWSMSSINWEHFFSFYINNGTAVRKYKGCSPQVIHSFHLLLAENLKALARFALVEQHPLPADFLPDTNQCLTNANMQCGGPLIISSVVDSRWRLKINLVLIYWWQKAKRGIINFLQYSIKTLQMMWQIRGHLHHPMFIANNFIMKNEWGK